VGQKDWGALAREGGAFKPESGTSGGGKGLTRRKTLGEVNWLVLESYDSITVTYVGGMWF